MKLVDFGHLDCFRGETYDMMVEDKRLGVIGILDKMILEKKRIQCYH